MIGWLAHEILRGGGDTRRCPELHPGLWFRRWEIISSSTNSRTLSFSPDYGVGLWIVEKAGRTKAGQKGPKKVVIETGGKNAIIVDADADLDQAPCRE